MQTFKNETKLKWSSTWHSHSNLKGSGVGTPRNAMVMELLRKPHGAIDIANLDCSCSSASLRCDSYRHLTRSGR